MLKGIRSLFVIATFVAGFMPAAFAGTYDLVIDETTVNFTGTERPAMAINGTVPAPTQARYKALMGGDGVG